MNQPISQILKRSAQVVLHHGGMVVFVLIFAGLGVALVLAARAATAVANLEAESGNKVNVTQVADTGASAGQAVRFGTPGISTELMRTSYPHAFALQNGTPVKVNGVNVRDVVYLGDVNNPGDNFAYPQSRWDAVKLKGFNTLRLQLNWVDFETAPGVFRAEAFTLLDQTVARAKAAGMYTIIDPIHLHTDHGNKPSFVIGADDIERVNSFGAPFVKAVAERYKNEPYVIAIDLVNEPKQSSLNQTRVMQMYDTLIQHVRPIDSDKILIVSPTGGGSSLANVDWSVLTNKTNLVMTYHNYFAGCEDDGFSASGWGNGCYVYDGTSGYNSPDIAQLAANVDAYINWLTVPQLPLYIGEYGIGNNAFNRDLWATHQAQIMNERSLSRTYWEWHSGATMALQDANYDWAPHTPILVNW